MLDAKCETTAPRGPAPSIQKLCPQKQARERRIRPALTQQRLPGLSQKIKGYARKKSKYETTEEKSLCERSVVTGQQVTEKLLSTATVTSFSP